MADNERLKKVVLWLISQGIVESQEDLAKKLGYNPSSVSQIITGIKPLSNKFANKLAELSGKINLDYLLTGDGKMLKMETPQGIMEITETVGVPYYEGIEATGGIVSLIPQNEMPTFYINYPHFNDCTAYLDYVGDSMYPKYRAGEIIAIKKVFNFDVILWGEAYFIITNDNANSLRTVKLLYQHEDESKIILRASNPNYKGDTVINKIDIISLFAVKGKISRDQL